MLRLFMESCKMHPPPPKALNTFINIQEVWSCGFFDDASNRGLCGGEGNQVRHIYVYEDSKVVTDWMNGLSTLHTPLLSHWSFQVLNIS